MDTDALTPEAMKKILMINATSKKGDRVLTVNRLGQRRVVKLKGTPLFNAEGQLVRWVS